MADVKTITQHFQETGSLNVVSKSIADQDVRESTEEMQAIYILKQKIDELVTEVNKLKNQ